MLSIIGGTVLEEYVYYWLGYYLEKIIHWQLVLWNDTSWSRLRPIVLIVTEWLSGFSIMATSAWLLSLLVMLKNLANAIHGSASIFGLNGFSLICDGMDESVVECHTQRFFNWKSKSLMESINSTMPQTSIEPATAHNSYRSTNLVLKRQTVFKWDAKPIVPWRTYLDLYIAGSLRFKQNRQRSFRMKKWWYHLIR